MSRRLLVLTRAFPYPPGEEFIGPEATHWPAPGRQVVVMPWWASGEARPVPGVEVDLTLARRPRRELLRATARAAVSPLFWRDLVWLGRRRRLSVVAVKTCLVATGNALWTKRALRRWLHEHGPVDVVYSYWWDAWTAGALLLKGEGVAAVATRVHGYDVHESRSPIGFHPLKRQLASRLDALLPVSRSGGEVAAETFGVDPSRVHHCPLGTALPEALTPLSEEGSVHLLSVASALPVKRIDRLVDAARLYAEAHPELQVHWTHVGGGALLEELQQRATGGPSNLHVHWLGQVSPDEVARQFERPLDLFVNTSESEGVPVSIMEAMAHGVPVLAPDVGAISEIVPASGAGGRLLGSSPEPQDIAAALAEYLPRARTGAERQAARDIVAENYDAQANADRVMGLLGQGSWPPRG